MDEKTAIKKMTLTGVLGNILLTAFKLFAGIYGKSGAMVSDAVHSLSDVFATFIAFLGTQISKRPADSEHPYGHERIECVASLTLGIILLITGIGIGRSGIIKIIGDRENIATPGVIALIAAVVSIVVKECMFRYTRHYARMFGSSVFMADAWHHRSDALSSVGSLIGIGGAMLGFPILDPIAGLLICAFIIKASFDILRDALKRMMDTSCGPDFDEKISELVSRQEGVEAVDAIQSRMFGNRIYIDLEIAVDRNKTVGEGHEIAERVHDMLEQNYDEVKHVMVHVNPTPEKSEENTCEK